MIRFYIIIFIVIEKLVWCFSQSLFYYIWITNFVGQSISAALKNVIKHCILTRFTIFFLLITAVLAVCILHSENKQIKFTVIEKTRNQKIFKFKKLESNNFNFLFFKIYQTDK